MTPGSRWLIFGFLLGLRASFLKVAVCQLKWQHACRRALPPLPFIFQLSNLSYIREGELEFVHISNIVIISGKPSYFPLLGRAAALSHAPRQGCCPHLTKGPKQPKPKTNKDSTYLAVPGRGQGQGWQKVGTPLTTSPMKPSGH